MRGATAVVAVLCAVGVVASITADTACDRCDPQKCPPVDTKCSTKYVKDKCGCCQVCDKAVENPTPGTKSEVKEKSRTPEIKAEVKEKSGIPVTEAEVRDKSVIPVIDSLPKPPNSFSRSLSDENESPVVTEDISIQIIPLAGGVINSAPPKQRHNFLEDMPILNRILKMFGLNRHHHHDSKEIGHGLRIGTTGTTAFPTCCTDDHMPKMTSQTEDKAIASRKGDLKEDIERLEPNLEDTVTVTRVKIIPFKVLVPNFGSGEIDGGRSVMSEVPHFSASPHIRFINLDSPNAPRNDFFTRRMAMHESPLFGPLFGSRTHNMFDDMLRMMMAPHLMRRKDMIQPKFMEPEVELENNSQIRKELEKVIKPIPNAVADHSFLIPNENENDDRLKMNKFKTEHIKSIAPVKENVTSQRPKHNEVFVDSPDFGKKQLNENVVDLKDNKTKGGVVKTVSKVEENSTVRNKRFTAQQPAIVEEKRTTISEQKTPENINEKLLKELQQKKAIKKKASLMLSNSNDLKMSVFPEMAAKGSAETERKEQEVLKDEIAKYLTMVARARQMKAELQALASMRKKKWANIMKQYADKPLKNRLYGNANSFVGDQYVAGNQIVDALFNRLHTVKDVKEVQNSVEKAAGSLKEVPKPQAPEGSGDGSISVKGGNDVADKTKDLANGTEMKTGRMMKKYKKNPSKTLMKLIENFREYVENIHPEAAPGIEGEDAVLKMILSSDPKAKVLTQ